MKTTDTKHTPTPWKVESIRIRGSGKHSIFRPCIITDEIEGPIIAEIYAHGNEGKNIDDTDKINAAFIVRAVNRDHVFDELLKAAKAIADCFPYVGKINSRMADDLQAAIAKAEGR